MGKQAKPRVLADSEAKSVLRNLRISPQKLSFVPVASFAALDASTRVEGPAQCPRATDSWTVRGVQVELNLLSKTQAFLR